MNRLLFIFEFLWDSSRALLVRLGFAEWWRHKWRSNSHLIETIMCCFLFSGYLSIFLLWLSVRLPVCWWSEWVSIVTHDASRHDVTFSALQLLKKLLSTKKHWGEENGKSWNLDGNWVIALTFCCFCWTSDVIVFLVRDAVYWIDVCRLKTLFDFLALLIHVACAWFLKPNTSNFIFSVRAWLQGWGVCSLVMWCGRADMLMEHVCNWNVTSTPVRLTAAQLTNF